MDHGSSSKISGGRILEMHIPSSAEQWCEFYGVEVVEGNAILFKAVNGDRFLSHNHTPEGKKISYAPGEKPEAPDWDAGAAECGGGLHFAPHPVMAEDFNGGADRFAACPVPLSEICVYPDGRFPEKVKARRVVEPGCWEVDRDGKAVA